jgi:hypothetical protein
MNRRKCAVFTIVKNEKNFLPIWLKHYRKYFSDYDIYVLDHQSTDGSTEKLPVRVETVNHDLSCDWHWVTNTIKEKQKELLKDYECVLFADCDELVYTVNVSLDKYIDAFLDNHAQYVTCQSYEVIQNLDKNEKNLSPGEEIFKNRDWWTRQMSTTNLYDKTLLSKIPLDWIAGQHSMNYPPYYTNNLYMVHLRSYDFEQLLKRNRRGDNWQPAPTHKHAAVTNSDRSYVYNWFIGPYHKPLEKIGKEHKLALAGI